MINRFALSFVCIELDRNVRFGVMLFYILLVFHQGRQFTEGSIRAAGYWFTGCRRLDSSLISQCVKCRKLRGNYCCQNIAELPADRLEPGPPFSNVGLGVDAFGP